MAERAHKKIKIFGLNVMLTFVVVVLCAVLRQVKVKSCKVRRMMVLDRIHLQTHKRMMIKLDDLAECLSKLSAVDGLFFSSFIVWAYNDLCFW
jgi:hypothetical protein